MKLRSSKQGVEAWFDCCAFWFANSKYLSTHFFASRTTKRQFLREGFSIPVSWLLQQKFVFKTFLSFHHLYDSIRFPPLCVRKKFAWSRRIAGDSSNSAFAINPFYAGPRQGNKGNQMDFPKSILSPSWSQQNSLKLLFKQDESKRRPKRFRSSETTKSSMFDHDLGHLWYRDSENGIFRTFRECSFLFGKQLYYFGCVSYTTK